MPQRGEQARLVEMALKNCAQTLSHETDKTGREIAALDELAKTLGLATPPSYIEAYDISNFGSSTKVAGMVVFENGKPLRSAYKRFRIKSVEGTDDYASMQEVIGRRLAEYQEKKDTGKGFGRLPDLILLDGGQGHLNAVQPILRAFGLDIPMYGMVKGRSPSHPSHCQRRWRDLHCSPISGPSNLSQLFRMRCTAIRSPTPGRPTGKAASSRR